MIAPSPSKKSFRSLGLKLDHLMKYYFGGNAFLSIVVLVLITILLTTYVVKQKYTETLSVKSFPSVTVTAGSPAMFPAAPTTPWNCPGGHANPAGATFCYACGVRHP